MDIHQLETFLAVVEEGSFSGAAKALGRTQPAVSQVIGRLEDELGQRLFAHLMRLPLSYFETRAAGQTVARMRELETIRHFLTGQGLFSARFFRECLDSSSRCSWIHEFVTGKPMEIR